MSPARVVRHVSFVAAVLSALVVVACVGGGGELPSERRAEDTSGVTGAGGTDRNTGSNGANAGSNGSGSTPTSPSDEDDAPPPCQEGAQCKECGALTGTIKCIDGRATCSCPTLPDAG